MRWKILSLFVLIWSPKAFAEPITQQSRVTLYGIGPVRAGMSVSEVENLTGQKLININEVMNDCTFMEFKNGPKGVHFMVEWGKKQIRRVDIGKYDLPGDRQEAPKIQTVAGVRIGDTDEHVKKVYPAQIRVESAPYGDENDESNRYLIYEPKDSRDKKFLLIFETYDHKVDSIRSGFREDVQLIEGCS